MRTYLFRLVLLKPLFSSTNCFNLLPAFPSTVFIFYSIFSSAVAVITDFVEKLVLFFLSFIYIFWRVVICHSLIIFKLCWLKCFLLLNEFISNQKRNHKYFYNKNGTFMFRILNKKETILYICNYLKVHRNDERWFLQNKSIKRQKNGVKNNK